MSIEKIIKDFILKYSTFNLQKPKTMKKNRPIFLNKNDYSKKIMKVIAILFFSLASFNSNAQALVANAGTDHAICAGVSDSLMGSASFGTPPYTFMWSSQFTSLANPTFQVIYPIYPASTETFTVVVTDNVSATASASVTITVNSNPTISPSTTTLDCINTSATLTASGGLNYIWNTGASTDSITVFSVGTYYLNESNTGCTSTSVTITQNTTPPTANFNSDFTSGCAPLNVNFADASTGAVSWSWTFAGGTPASSTVQNPTNIVYNAAGTYNVTLVAYSSGGCADTVPSTITVYANPIANFSPSATSGCAPLNVSFTNTSSGASVYSWDFGDGITSTLANPSHSYLQAGNYLVSLIATSVAGCADTASSINISTSATDIFGIASYSGGAVANSSTVLFKLSVASQMDTIQVTQTGASGNYQFTSIPDGQYLVKVFPDTATYHTSLIPTYYGNKFQWDAAFVINHTCTKIDSADIMLIEPIGTGSGPGNVWGFIQEGAGYRNIGDPIPGVDVKLGKNPGGIAASATTNNLGNYTWKNLAVGNYTIYVDVPGLGLDSTYTFNVDAVTNQYAQLNFTVDSASVYKDNFVVLFTNNIPNYVQKEITLYPNPTNGNVTIEYTTNSDSKISIGIYNVLGIKVADIVNTNQSAGTHKYKINTKNYNLSAGIYFITLVTNGKTSIERLVISE